MKVSKIWDKYLYKEILFENSKSHQEIIDIITNISKIKKSNLFNKPYFTSTIHGNEFFLYKKNTFQKDAFWYGTLRGQVLSDGQSSRIFLFVEPEKSLRLTIYNLLPGFCLFINLFFLASNIYHFGFSLIFNMDFISTFLILLLFSSLFFILLIVVILFIYKSGTNSMIEKLQELLVRNKS